LDGTLLQDDARGKATPLHLAVQSGETETCKLLLALGADPTAKNSSGLSSLDLARKRKAKALIHLFLSSLKGSEEPVISEKKKNTSESKETEEAPAILKKDLAGLDWKIGTSVEREQQLLRVCVSGNLEQFNRLMELQVSLLCRDLDGNQPLHLAARNGHLELCKSLIEKGVWRNARNCSSWTALHCAAVFGSLSLIKYLMEEILLDPHDETIDDATAFGLCKNPAALSWMKENDQRLKELRDEDLRDHCIRCHEKLSLKFGDSLETIPSCASRRDRKKFTALKRIEISDRASAVREVFHPLSGLNLFELRFGVFSTCCCEVCSQSGSSCRCLIEMHQGAIPRPHIPAISSKIAILAVFSRKFNKGETSSLKVLKESSIFDPNALMIIFSFL
jgi:hypothetical protein